MNVILFICLASILTINLLIYNWELLSPAILACGFFTLSAFLLTLQFHWGVEISGSTALFIIMCIVFFCVGCLVGEKGDKKRIVSIQFEGVRYHKILWKTFSFICLLITLYYVYYQFRLSISLGNTKGLIGVIGTIRNNIISNPDILQLGVWMNFGICYCRAMGFISLFYMVMGLASKQKVISTYILPVVCMIVNMIFATGRGAVLGVFITLVFHIYLLLVQNGRSFNNKTIIKYALSGIIIFSFVFQLLGNLTGKTALYSFSDTVAIYMSSSLLCLDNFMKSGWTISSPFGQNTFPGIYNIFHLLGMSVPYVSHHAEMFRWGGIYSSNIYTCYFPYLLDFGVVFTIVLQFFLGILFGKMWKKYKSFKGGRLFYVTYGRFWGSALVYFPIAERLFSDFLALNVLVEILFYLLILKVFFPKQINEVV